MVTKTLLLDTVDKVKEFSAIMRDVKYSADITSGRYIVSAHSILGILSLDLAKPVSLVVHDVDDHVTTEAEISDFLHDISAFIKD